MKLAYCCSYCSVEIFKADNDLCWKAPAGKHKWNVVEEKEEKNPNLKEIIYV